MLRAEELRIGNIVNYLGKFIVCNANTIYAISKIKQPSKIYLPIPLTEEILLKCGFEKRGMTDNFYCFGYGENPITKDWILSLKYLEDENMFFFLNGYHKIKYVHQLQNLYFALTNNELTINL